jgi:CRP-like cAMP-binding protein
MEDMSRTGTAHRYELAKDVQHSGLRREGQTLSQYGITTYLKLRNIEGAGGATQAEIVEDSGLSVRTVGIAIRQLRDTGTIK